MFLMSGNLTGLCLYMADHAQANWNISESALDHVNIQELGVDNNEEKKTTGILLWDLSAAFDTLDPILLCQKLALYGFDDRAVNWIRSYLTGRSQCIQIGRCINYYYYYFLLIVH